MENVLPHDINVGGIWPYFLIRSFFQLRFNNLAIHYFFWLFIYLFPALKWVQGGVGTAQKVLHLIIFLFVVTLVLIKKPAKPDRKIIYFLLTYLLVTVPYYILTTLAYTSDLSWQDTTDFTRPFVYLLYLFIPLLYPISGEQLKSLMKFFIIACLIQIVFSAFVYFPALWGVADIYKGRMSDDSVVFHFFRWSGTYGYPSDFAFYLSFFIYYQYFKLVDAKKQFQSKDWLFVFVLFLALFLTLSRGGIGTVIIMLGLSYLFGRGRKSKAVNLTLVAIIVASVFAITSVSLSDEKNNMLKVEYLESMFEGDEMDDSTSHRVKEMDIAVEFFEECFPFGCGSNRIGIKKRIAVLESLYGYHMAKWGAFGLVLYFIFLFWIIDILKVTARNYERGSFESIFSYATLLLVVSIPIAFGFSSAMSDRFKALPLYYLFVGYVINLYLIKKRQMKITEEKTNLEGKH